MLLQIKKLLKRNRLILSIYRYIVEGWRRYWLQHNGILFIGEITSVLNKKGVFAFADFGTLLGIVREGCLLQNDMDIDIGILGDTDVVVKKIQQSLTPLSYKLVREFKLDGRVAEQSYRKKHVRIDFQYYEVDVANDYMLCYLFHKQSPESETRYAVEKRCSIVRELERKKIEGVSVFIPQNAVQLLVDKYGEDWRTPDKGFHYWEAPNTKLTEKVCISKKF